MVNKDQHGTSYLNVYSQIAIIITNLFKGIDNISGCKKVHVGKSGTNSKMVIIDSGLNCPITVNKTNWLNEDDNGDIYSVMKSGSQITVTRTDKSGIGWANDLKFRCCFHDGNLFDFKL